jgi:hypothetical protein
MAEWPANTVARLEAHVTAEQLAQAILALLRDDKRRASLIQAGRAFVREHTFARLADVVFRAAVRARRPIAANAAARVSGSR